MERASNLRNKIDNTTVLGIRTFVSEYDKETDTLIIQPETPIPAVSVDWDGDFWVRVNPASGEILGIVIEDYKAFFAKKYHLILRGHGVTDPIIKELIIALVASVPKPFTKKDFVADLKKVSQHVLA